MVELWKFEKKALGLFVCNNEGSLGVMVWDCRDEGSVGFVRILGVLLSDECFERKRQKHFDLLFALAREFLGVMVLDWSNPGISRWKEVPD